MIAAATTTTKKRTNYTHFLSDLFSITLFLVSDITVFLARKPNKTALNSNNQKNAINSKNEKNKVMPEDVLNCKMYFATNVYTVNQKGNQKIKAKAVGAFFLNNVHKPFIQGNLSELAVINNKYGATISTI